MPDINICDAVRDYRDLIQATVKRFYPKLKKRFTREDLESDCYMKLWQATERWNKKKGGVSFGLYAKVAMENAMFERLKRKQLDIHSLTVLSDEGDLTELEFADFKQPTQYQSYLAKQAIDSFQNLLPDEKMVLCEVIFNGSGFSEVSKDLELSRQRVHQKYKSGINKIKGDFCA